MHAILSRSLRFAPRYTTVGNCRVIAGRRFPITSRSFRPSTRFRNFHDDSTNTADVALNHVKESPEELPLEETDSKHEEVEEAGEVILEKGPSEKAVGKRTTSVDLAPHETEATETDETAQTKVIDRSTYGSGMKRATRATRRPRELPLPEIPSWFLKRNVLLHEQIQCENIGLDVIANSEPASSDLEAELRSNILSPGPKEPESQVADENISGASPQKNDPEPQLEDQRYQIDEFVMREIIALASAGLRSASSAQAQYHSTSKPHLVLQSPQGGGDYYLETVIKHTARYLGADLIKIDAQDIAEIAGGLVGEIPSYHLNALSSLGYDTHIIDDQESSVGGDYGEGTEGPFPEADEDNATSRTKPNSTLFPRLRGSSGGKIGPIASIIPQDLFKIVKVFIPNPTSQPGSSSPKPSKDAINPLLEAPYADKEFVLFDTFLDSTRVKRQALGPSTTTQEASANAKVVSAPNSKQEAQVHDVIVMVQDYLEMHTTSSGGAILAKLHDIVKKRRKDGQRIIIIGTTSAEDLIPSQTAEGFKSLQTEPGQGPYRTIVTPCKNDDAENMFLEDEKARTKHINIRHIQDMLRQITPKVEQVGEIVSQADLEFDSAQVFAWGMNEYVWSYEQIHRIATTALGLIQSDQELTPEHLACALNLLEASDKTKSEWLERDYEQHAASPPNVDKSSDHRKIQEEKMKKLRKTCNSHEKKLLSGVVDASGIHSTFDDVRTPPETVEALKTLTSLSLIRPEAFTYGVLATDKIPGLLLYGPPGTGKTLLAKAVAKESGATVLEVSGSDINDMYVGEGEKNVRAIFTLAKKLSPCVVFIDEADAIFGSRNNSGNRTSHRELINQFLREWDGLSDLSAFIMVATNRPFDLDDAVLRRLPRRLLIDLPTEADREAILRIHLKDEILAPDVSLSSLATNTPFYSGSDLKNLSVAAALACVREENEAAAAATSSSSSSYSASSASSATTPITTDTIYASTTPPSTTAEPPDSNEDQTSTKPTYTYPEKRTLTASHFEKGLAEISASISEDMSSLAAIRKFD